MQKKKSFAEKRSSEREANTRKIFHRNSQKKLSGKDTYFTRERKIKYFVDKMKAEEQQQDNIAKLAKDLIANQFFVKAKHLAAMLGALLMSVGGIVTVTTMPIILVIVLVYNSPFAIFFPPIESGDTVATVTSSYVAEFHQTVRDIADTHTGHDRGEIVYVDYEGAIENPSNYYDILSVYMVKYGVGDTATIVNDMARNRIKEIVDDMCSYSTSSESVVAEDEDGNETTEKVLKVKVVYKTYRDMISVYEFNSDKEELLEKMMSPDSLIMLGYTGFGDGSGSQTSLSYEEVTTILNEITDPAQKAVCRYVLSKVGFPYSQAYRDTGRYYDCSSLAYYAWIAGGKDISYGGANTAAAEAQGLYEADKTIEFSEMQPGDLIFFSYTKNGRFKNISHVAVYVGNGKVVEAKNEKYGVVYGEVPSRHKIVMIGRP